MYQGADIKRFYTQQREEGRDVEIERGREGVFLSTVHVDSDTTVTMKQLNRNRLMIKKVGQIGWK
jgi:hypothetical protein